MEDRIAKQKMNIILLVDASKSMGGPRMSQVDQAVKDIKDFLIDFQNENSNADFFLTIIPFSNFASFYEGKTSVNVNDLQYDHINTGGWSNLHCAYQKLQEILRKESKGGIMPDFGGIAPLILLLTDGHPTGAQYKEELTKLKSMPWFKASMRYGVAIELSDDKTHDVLRSFVEDRGDVVRCVDSKTLKDIIKIIVVTASKVSSQSNNVSFDLRKTSGCNVIQHISEALSETGELEW